VAPDESVEFVARFLKHDDETLRELAALALGESRLDAALEPLKAAWKEPWTHLDLRSALVRAAAAHRSPAAHDWLMKIVDEADVRTVARVVDALVAFRHDSKLLGRLKDVLERRADSSLLAQYAKLVGDDRR
jgi:HEAT repeat protein